MVSVQKVSFGSSTNLLERSLNNQNLTKQETTKPKQNTQDTTNTNEKLNKGLIAATAALASVGTITGVVLAIKNNKLNKAFVSLAKENKTQATNIGGLKTTLENTITTLTEKVEAGLSEADKKISQQINQGLERADQKITREIDRSLRETDRKIRDLGKWEDGQISGLRNDMNAKIQEVKSIVKADGMDAITVSPTIVNGTTLELATVRGDYGQHTHTIEQALRQESAKRILGVVDRSKLVPPDDIMIRVPTSEFKGFTSTGGMSVVPREIVANLGAMINNKQNAKLVVDTPLYLGQVENDAYYHIVRDTSKGENFYTYFKRTERDGEQAIANLEKIDEMQLPIYTDKGKTTETVQVFLSRDNKQIVDLELLIPWLEPKLAEKVTASINTGKPFSIETDLVSIKYNPETGVTKPRARVKYDVVLYKHDKFKMDGPVRPEFKKNIYNNETQEAKETERFMYFDKFFYEHLLRNSESSSVPLRADLIIGNDWQTGGISAMMKMLTTVKRYFGLDPKVAEKIYNTPILTIMHNAGLSGNTWEGQAKLLNILFGEHSAMITRNAWMPQNASLKGDALNGLFHGSNLNPQTMAAAYSDVITPVSKGYGREMASHSGFGGDNHDIFRIRGRYHEFEDIEHLKYIARQNGLDPSLIPEENLAYRPITNGCDRVNNLLTDPAARKIEQQLGLERGSLITPGAGKDIFEVHQHNKGVYLNKIIKEIDAARNGQGNEMKIRLAEMTDLTGVTQNTMVISTAGRIVDQKGLDIFANAIEEFLEKNHSEKNMPVFYAQGNGDSRYIEKFLEVKRRVAQKYGQKAANRIVFADLFSEAGRYDGCKMMSDFTVMSSWFEPCGLVHKEIAAFSGSIPVINKVGGLTDGLTNMENAIFADFIPKFDNEQLALEHNKKQFGAAIEKAYRVYKNKSEFRRMMQNSFSANHSWLKAEGPMEEYAKVLVDLKVLKPEVLEHR